VGLGRWVWDLGRGAPGMLFVTWQCSGVALTSLKELLKKRRRRVDSASETPTSNEMCCPTGT
jgi:hypothetical protein